MHGELVLLGVLIAIGACLVVSYLSRIPYPIPLVLAGTALAFVPGLEVDLEPEVILIAFLPPLLYSAAFFSSLQDLRANVRPIGLLALGLVVVTMVAVAVVAHTLIDTLSWPAAFVLGAIVSPTDPVAATAIARRLSAPRRMVTIVEGESLINDSTGLIAYKFAVAAVLTGTFSLGDALLDFAWSAVAGVAIGLAVAVAVAALRRRLDDAPTEIAISLLTPYVAYLPAEALGVSAVLAAVTAGLYLGWRSPELITPSTRIQAFAFWDILVFALNAVLFILVGLQLHRALDALEHHTAVELIGYALAVAGTVVLVRVAWIFPLSYLPRVVSRRLRERDPMPDPRVVGLLAWTGMRGAVSLAAALAIPLETDAGAPFPERDLIIFLAYAVILATVVGQGLTLPALIAWSGVRQDPASEAEEEARARAAAARAALERLARVTPDDYSEGMALERLRRRYESRLERFQAQADDGHDTPIELHSQLYDRLRREILAAERAEILRARNRGAISDDVMRRIERDLDLEDARLEGA